MKTYIKSLFSTVNALIVTLVFMATPVQAAPFAYVGNNDIQVIDTASNDVVDTIVGGDNEFNAVAVHPDGHTLYASALSPATNDVFVIDTTTGTIVDTIVGAGSELAVHPQGTYLYVGNGSTQTISVIDTATNDVIDAVEINNFIGDLAVHPDGSYLYVGGSGYVYVIDTNTNTLVDTISAGIGEHTTLSLAVHPDGSRLYYRDAELGQVGIIDTATNTVLDHTNLDVFLLGIAVHPQGTAVYVSSDDTDTVYVLDPDTLAVTDEVLVGASPGYMATHPEGSSLYVVTDQFIAVIDTATNTVIDTIPLASPIYITGIDIGPLPTAIGGSATGLALDRVGCINFTSRQRVALTPAPGTTSWDCEAAGLTAETGDVIFMQVNGTADADAGTATAGATTGLDRLRDVACRDSTSGQAELINFTDNTTTWDCEAEGLVVNPGDEIWMRIRGKAD